MTLGQTTFVLHTHLPYCRLAGNWPHGEEWIHEATLECYLPLLQAFRRLAQETPGSLGVTINVTPILAEQLRDPTIIDHFRTYIAGRVQRAEEDARRFSGNGLRKATSEFHRDRYRATQAFFEDTLHGDILSGLAELESAGHIEIATSAATHGYLPLLVADEAVRFQVKSGVEAHRRNFGRAPRSFWLPECAYSPGLEQYLEEAGIKVFFVETHLITGGAARGKAVGDILGPYDQPNIDPTPIEFPDRPLSTFRAYRVGQSTVSVIGRNERTGMQVWSAAHGYPGDFAYREFHKKDDVSGLHYWRVTGSGVDLGQKADYDPAIAAGIADSQAMHFHGVITSEMESYRRGSGEPGLVLQAYDTELFGHWWLEGVQWLEGAIRRLAADPEIELVTAGDYIAKNPPSNAVSLPEGSWGDGGDHRTWANASTNWTWPEIRARQARARVLLGESNAATRQLGRELLLLQSSDWQFLMTTRQAHDYAVERFNSHCRRFDALATAIEANDPATDAIVAGFEALDNPFPDLDPRNYRPLPTGART